MQLNRHEDSPWQDWRPGVKTRVWSSASQGANSLHMGEQICQPGTGAPYHWHYYEEHITIFSGTAEVKIDGKTAIVEGPATVIVPPRLHHGFTNVGEGELRIIGATSWPILEAGMVDDPDGVLVRGWEPGYGYRRRRMVEEGKPR